MKKFTLIELLIVIAVLSILISLLLSSISKTREEVKVGVCSSNLSQIYRGLVTYSQANNSYFPWTQNHTQGQWVTRRFNGETRSIGKLVSENIITNTKVFYCPAWTHPVVQYNTRDRTGKYGGWPGPGGEYPTRLTWTSYAYRHYPNTGHPKTGSASLMRNDNNIAILADHWTKRKNTDFGWKQGSGRFTHYAGDKYVTTFLDGRVSITHDKSHSLIVESVEHSSIYKIENAWRIFFDKD